MHVVKNLFNFYLDASVHVALAVASLYVYTVLELDKTPNFYLIAFLVTGTIVCYNFMKYGVEAEKYLIVHRPYHKNIQVFSFLCFPMAVYCFFNLPDLLWFPIAFLTLLSGLYILPFLPSSKNLRTLGGFKIYLVALVWVGFTVFLPVLEYQVPIDLQVFLKMIRRFVLVIILFIPFEIRDLKVDSPELRTLPQRIGIDGAKKTGFALVVLYFLLGVLTDFSMGNFVIEMVSFAVLWTIIMLTQKKQPKYYASFWVEGIPIFLLIGRYTLDALA